MEVVLPQEKNGGAGLDEKENLRRFLYRGKAGEWLLDPVIVHAEIFATQAFDEAPAVIGDDHPDVDAVNANLNRLLRLMRILLGTRERAHTEHGGEEQCRPQKTKRVHRSAIQPTGPNGCPSHPSTRHSKSNADAARRLADRSARASREPWTPWYFWKNLRFSRPGPSSPLRSNDPSTPANRLFQSRNN